MAKKKRTRSLGYAFFFSFLISLLFHHSLLITARRYVNGVSEFGRLGLLDARAPSPKPRHGPTSAKTLHPSYTPRPKIPHKTTSEPFEVEGFRLVFQIDLFQLGPPTAAGLSLPKD